MAGGAMEAAQRKIGPYHCLARVAGGGMGTVWRVALPDRPTEAAIKIMHPHLARLRTARADFAREYEYGRRFHNEFLLRFYDRGAHEGCPYFVMEYFPSATLKSLILGPERPKLLTLGEKLIRQAARALGPVHAAGVVHRDIKPDNVLVGNQELAEGGLLIRIIDFSTAIGGWRRWFPWGRRAAGTPTYVAPEIIRGGTPAPAADVFSFGATLYELFAGRPPFAGDNQQEVLRKRLTTRPDPLDKWNPAVSDAFVKYVSALLEKDPRARPPDMTSALARFDRVGGIFRER